MFNRVNLWYRGAASPPFVTAVNPAKPNQESTMRWNIRGDGDLKCEEYPNNFLNVKLADLHMPYYFGTCTVILEGKFYFNLYKEDILYAVNDGGVLPGGILTGAFCFVYKGSQLRLTKVGSPLWVNATKTRTSVPSKPLTSTQVLPGHAYTTKETYGNKFVILGDVYVPLISKIQGYGHWQKPKVYLTPTKCKKVKLSYAMGRYWVEPSSPNGMAQSLSDVLAGTFDKTYYSLKIGVPTLHHEVDFKRWDHFGQVPLDSYLIACRRFAEWQRPTLLAREIEDTYSRNQPKFPKSTHWEYADYESAVQYLLLRTCSPLKQETIDLYNKHRADFEEIMELVEV